jgi:hypothetical protein
VGEVPPFNFEVRNALNYTPCSRGLMLLNIFIAGLKLYLKVRIMEMRAGRRIDKKIIVP